MTSASFSVFTLDLKLRLCDPVTVTLHGVILPMEYDTLQRLYSQVFLLLSELVPSGQVVPDQ